MSSPKDEEQSIYHSFEPFNPCPWNDSQPATVHGGSLAYRLPQLLAADRRGSRARRSRLHNHAFATNLMFIKFIELRAPAHCGARASTAHRLRTAGAPGDVRRQPIAGAGCITLRAVLKTR
jgi:hypothetical protein